MNLLEIAADGKTLYIGGTKVISIANEGRNSKLPPPDKKPLKKSPVRDIRCLSDGRIVVHVAKSNNLEFYDTNFNLKDTLPGVPGQYDCKPPAYLFRRKL